VNKLINAGKLALLVAGATFAIGSYAAQATTLAAVAANCKAAADWVNKHHGDTVKFRPSSGKGIWWCATTDREGTLIAVRASDTLEDGCTQTSFKSDAARLSELIAVAKAWTTSFSNNEAAVDSRTAGLASRIDGVLLGGTFGKATGTNVGPAALWGVWATNLLRHSDRPNGYTCGKRHFGVVPFAGGVPVYDCHGHLIGGAGASGDSVDADDLVTRQAIKLAGLCDHP
jgi:hypothetical protein